MLKRVIMMIMSLALGSTSLPRFQAGAAITELSARPPQTVELSESEATLPDLQKRRAEFFFNQRAFPFGFIPPDWRLKALEHMHNDMPRVAQQPIALPMLGPLTPIGPAPIANGQTLGMSQNVTGRVTALALDPQNSSTIYLGAAQGGLWRSIDGGQTWQPLTDNAPTQAIGAIAIDPTNPNIIYLGTGEGNFSGDSFFGMGLLKSTDGGQTWVNLAAQTFVGRSFNKLLIDPGNPQTLYAAIGAGLAGIGGSRGTSVPPERAPNGIYKSTDGGVTWTNILLVPAPSDPLGRASSAFDLVMDPTNSSVLYATIYAQGIFKTSHAGQSWIKLSGGLPTDGFGRPEIGLANSNPTILYAAFADEKTDDLLNLFKSSDGGQSWAVIARPAPFGTICQCRYDNFIEVDPVNPDVVYFGGVSLYKSTNGGQFWINIGAQGGGLHPDFHAMVFIPDNSSQFYIGNDGGVWFTSNGGRSFINRNNNLNITQFQSISLHPTDRNTTLGGTQDNGTNLYVGTTTWEQVDGGDGGFSAIDQTNPNVMYHTYFNIASSLIGLVRSDRGGGPGTWRVASAGIDQQDDVLFYAPFILDPNNQSTLYFGTFRLYRSTNRGNTWTPLSDQLTAGDQLAAISAITVAAGAPQVIYTGSSDGAVFASQDGGMTFENVTGNLPQRYISDIVVDPASPRTVYVSLSGFRSGHIFKSTTGGRHWEDISGNLPDVPANALVINPLNVRHLAIGTDIGLFQTNDGGTSWVPVPGMPAVTVYDIAINTNLGLVRIATHGRGVYEAKLM